LLRSNAQQVRLTCNERRNQKQMTKQCCCDIKLVSGPHAV